VSDDGFVVEQGLADAWGLTAGDTIDVGGYAARIVGLARSPDNVAYPLASPRVFVPSSALGASAGEAVNLAEIWLRDPSQLSAVLVQARTSGYGLRDLSTVTRSGVRVLIDRLVALLNEAGPGAAPVLPLAACWTATRRSTAPRDARPGASPPARGARAGTRRG
jgi:predicted lysophospholipase L1 biosynthesis ABC-type transport system permease subunit